MADLSDDDILAELGVSIEPKKARLRTPREERVIAGFEDIVRFYEEHRRAPRHGEGLDIFERIYAVRLDRLRELPDCRALLREMDTHGLLETATPLSGPDELDDEALLNELGVAAPEEADITVLRNVRSSEERQAAEEIANQTRCEDFARFKPLFVKVERDLTSGERTTRPFGTDASINHGDFFILRGQVAYVADVGEILKAPNGQFDARLRVVYSNGTESNLLRWSLQRALYKDEGGRRITEPSAGPLFADPDAKSASDEPDHLASGTLYVLRSRSTHPKIAENRDLVHKIGITGGSVAARVAGAADDATYLLADVDVVATYKLYDINPRRLEALIHRTLCDVQFDAEIPDRFGKPVRPREWFMVPLPIIDELVSRIADGTIVGAKYDPAKAAFVSADT